MNIPLITDLLQIHERQQIIIDERLQHANIRREHNQPGDEIFILTSNPFTLHKAFVLVLLPLHQFIQMVQLHFNSHHTLCNVSIFAESTHIETDSAHSGEECYIPRALTLTRLQ